MNPVSVQKPSSWRRAVRLAVCLLTGLGAGAAASAQTNVRVLHHFTGGASDGARPIGSLVSSGPALFGMTHEGGRDNRGTVFRLKADGTGFQLMHSFVAGADDGQSPIGSLILSGTSLYGMASGVGGKDGGTVFRIDAEGSGFQVLRRFGGSDGQWPWGTLLQSGSVLYGLNSYGGDTPGWKGKGTAFRINTDGSDFRVIHAFSGGANDGMGPHGTFVQSGAILYATTLVGGRHDLGTLFRIDPNGSDFQILHHFGGGNDDGSRPYNVALVQIGSALYGTTLEGGPKNMGTVFRVNADGSGFGLLHRFTGGREGQKPFGSLILVGAALYGLTSDENTGTNGTVFRINPDGTGFEVVHRFNGADGRNPSGTLLECGGKLYGMTSQGGSRNKGVVFALDLAASSTTPARPPSAGPAPR